MKAIIICGAPGTGKTTIALGLAQKYGIYQLIGTDTIREIARKYSSKEKTPSLYTSAILFSRQNAGPLWGFQKQAQDMKEGMTAVLHRSAKEDKDIILEGIHPIPGIFSFSHQDSQIFHIVLAVTSEIKHRLQISGQGSHRSEYKIDNFEKARAYQKFLLQQAALFHAVVIENETIESTLEKLSQVLTA